MDWRDTPFSINIDNQHPLAARLKLLDREGSPISRVVGFNLLTFEATKHDGDKVEVAAVVLEPPQGHPAYEANREKLFKRLTDPNYETGKIS